MKGYITIEYEGTERVDVEDVLCEVSDELLKQEAIERGLIIEEKEDNQPFFSNNKEENKRKLCKLLDLNYFTRKVDIIHTINEKL